MSYGCTVSYDCTKNKDTWKTSQRTSEVVLLSDQVHRRLVSEQRVPQVVQRGVPEPWYVPRALFTTAVQVQAQRRRRERIDDFALPRGRRRHQHRRPDRLVVHPIRHRLDHVGKESGRALYELRELVHFGAHAALQEVLRTRQNGRVSKPVGSDSRPATQLTVQHDSKTDDSQPTTAVKT